MSRLIDRTVSHEFVSVFVYIIADIEGEAEVDIEPNNDSAIQMENTLSG